MKGEVGTSALSGGKWDPLSRACPSAYLGSLPGHEVVAEGLHGELHGVPQLVAEVAVTKDTVDIQVDVPAWR